MICIGGPADGIDIYLKADETMVRVPAERVRGLVGVYRLISEPPDGGGPRLRYDYSVEFEYEGERYICHEVVSSSGNVRNTATSAVRWAVRVGHRSCDADTVDHHRDFRERGDFITRMVRAARGAGVCGSIAPGTTA